MAYFYRRNLQLISLLGLVLLSACTKPFVKVDDPKVFNSYIDKIAQYNDTIRQVKTTMNISMSGLMGSFVNEKADVVVQSPDKIYWSLRSFFGSPATIITANANFITIFDLSGQSENPYQKLKINDDTFIELFDFPFHPKSLVTMFLATFPLPGATSLQVFRRDDVIQIKAYVNDGWRSEALFDLQKNTLLELKLFNEKSGTRYHVKYHDVKKINGISFPTRHVVKASGKNRSATFKMELDPIEINGELISEDAFYLEAH